MLLARSQFVIFTEICSVVTAYIVKENNIRTALRQLILPDTLSGGRQVL